MSAGLGVGYFLILLALAFLLLVLVIVAIRRSSRKVAFSPRTDSLQNPPISSDTKEALLLVQSGGRIEYINELGRDWFGLSLDESPDLERLIRRARPAEEFLGLCAKPGQKRISVGSQLVEATSYQVPGVYPQMLIALKTVEFSREIIEKGGSSVLRLISDFGKELSASLDLNDVLHAILLNVSQLISSDILEIKTWDTQSRSFTIFTLDATGSARVQQVPQSQFGNSTTFHGEFEREFSCAVLSWITSDCR